MTWQEIFERNELCTIMTIKDRGIKVAEAELGAGISAVFAMSLFSKMLPILQGICFVAVALPVVHIIFLATYVTYQHRLNGVGKPEEDLFENYL